jgi:predicted ATP-grasp superfamily ATP-dependent carboligase
MQLPANRGTVLLVGASCRAAAWSARRGGFLPFCVTRFGDADLSATGQFVLADLKPAAVAQAVERFPACPIVVLGGCDLQGEMLERLSKARRIVGMPHPAVVAKLREPANLEAWAAESGFGFPAWSNSSPRDTLSPWLLKDRWSAGGMGVTWAAKSMSPPSKGGYWQRYIPGAAHGAVLLVNGGRSQLVCVSAMLSADPGPEQIRDFRYRGSCGPLPVRKDLGQRLEAIADRVAATCELSGLLNIDFLIDPEGDCWLLEVNPRYSSSCELFERSSGASLIAAHVEAADGHASALPAGSQNELWRKEVIYAAEAWVAPKDWPVTSHELCQRMQLCKSSVVWADLPWPDQPHPLGVPVLTLLTRGRSQADAERHATEARAALCTTFHLRPLP